MADDQDTATAPGGMKGDDSKKNDLMNFADEEEENDDDEGGENPLLLGGSGGSSSAAPKAKPASNALMDFADEEEEDEQDRLLMGEAERKKKKMVVSDASEEDEEEEEEEEEEEQDEVRKRKEKKQRKMAESPTKGDDDMEEEDRSDGGEEEEEEEEYRGEQAETITSITVPSLEAYRSRQTSKCFYAQLPRFLFVDGGAFNEDRYRFEKEKEEIRARNGEQLVGDEIIRWRVKTDASGSPLLDTEGQPVLESNARVVEFTDGTYQLFVGNEAIDLKLLQTSNEFLYARTTETSEEGNERLCMQALGAVEGQAAFLPAGPDSKQHKALEYVVKRQQIKEVKMVDTNPDLDPEREQDERIKKVDALHRSNLRRRNKAENSLAAKKRRLGEWSSEYLEKPSSLNRKKKGASGKKKTGGRRDDDYDDEVDLEEEEEEDELDSFIASSSEDDDDDE